MRYTPSASECSAVEHMTDTERLEYFLTRTFETEEVWGLGNTAGWLMRERDGDTILPVWPFRQLVAAGAGDDGEAHAPNAISLEHFVYRTLQVLIDQGVKLEVMPREAAAGCVVDPQQLLQLFEGVIDAGEYRLEG